MGRGSDAELVHDILDAGDRPGGFFDDVALVPGIDLAFEANARIGDGDADALCLDLGIALQGLLDLVLDVGGLNFLLDRDQIGNAGDAGDFSDA